MPSKQASAPPETDLPPDDSEATPEASNRPFWSGTISFGLVSIPVDLYPALRSSRISLRMLSPEGVPLQRRYFAANSEEVVPNEHQVRGYPTQDESFVTVTDEELDRLAPEKSRYIELRRFVEVANIHPLYFEKAYFLTPSGESTRAYKLLAATMEETGRAGIADFVMRGQAYPAAIFAENGILRLQTLRYHDELRTPDDVGLPAPNPDEAEVTRLRKLIAKHKPSKPTRKELTDVSTEQLRELIETKRKKNEDVVRIEDPERAQAEVVDIMDTLKRSLAALSSPDAAPKKTAAKKKA